MGLKKKVSKNTVLMQISQLRYTLFPGFLLIRSTVMNSYTA